MNVKARRESGEERRHLDRQYGLLRAGYIYAPYVPVELLEVQPMEEPKGVLQYLDFQYEPSKPINTRYATTAVNTEYYSTLSI